MDNGTLCWCKSIGNIRPPNMVTVTLGICYYPMLLRKVYQMYMRIYVYATGPELRLFN